MGIQRKKKHELNVSLGNSKKLKTEKRETEQLRGRTRKKLNLEEKSVENLERPREKSVKNHNS